MTFLYEFAYVPNPSGAIDDLARLAQEENWDYRYTASTYNKPILFNYLHYTFQRLREESKVAFSKRTDKACFNTGLVTENQEEIYALFDINPNPGNQQWRLNKFCKASDRDLLSFNPLPEIAHYFSNPNDLLYDIRLDKRINYDHIIDDNKARFPAPYNSQTTYQLKNYLVAVVDQAIKRVKRNYKTAIPQYYQGRIQLLLPLCLDHPAKADLALVIERNEDVYRANTCLTLDMAYNNARLLAKPDTEWLQP